MDDDDRVAAVRDLLRTDGSARDAALSDLNRLATRLLGVPVSLVSLVEGDRQVFSGRHGLAEQWDDAGQTPLSHSLCQHVVATGAPLVIGDVGEEPIVGGELARRDLGVVAYAGVPLRSPEGQALGAFCAIDDRPRAWGEDELDVLRALAAVAQDHLELRRLRAGVVGRDALTGAYTRELFEQLVQHALAPGAPTAVVALGIHDLRLVNEAFGHAAGDGLVLALADRLAATVGPADVVCRLTGDEFLVLLDAPTDHAGASASAERLRRRLSDAPYDVGGATHGVTVSVGVAVGSRPLEAHDLIDHASDALGRSRRGAIDPGRLAAQARSTLRLRSSIVGAEARGELHLAYQPVVELATGAVRAVEALVRWTHPQLGPIGPDEFIPAAELSGAIVPLGEWVVRQACADVARWRRLPGMQDLAVSVNVAPVQLGVPSFPDTVAAALADAGLPARALAIEITERTLLADGDVFRNALERLHGAGVRVAIDDFGTGYSSLSYLTRVPADVLKIDRAFVEHLHDDDRAHALVTGILGLADGLGLRTVAEGVETARQHDTLLAAGFTWAQGYLYSRPVRADDLAALLTAAPSVGGRPQSRPRPRPGAVRAGRSVAA